MCEEPVIGRIEFENSREWDAMSTLYEVVLEKEMWKNIALRKEDEIEKLRKNVEELQKNRRKYHGKKVHG